MSTEKPLAPLFKADRLSIIGASDRNHYAVNIFKNLQNMGFDLSRIIPINPGRPEVFGLKTYPSILDVPGEIPLAVIAVNNKAVASRGGEKRRQGRSHFSSKRSVLNSFFTNNSQFSRSPCMQIGLRV